MGEDWRVRRLILVLTLVLLYCPALATEITVSDEKRNGNVVLVAHNPFPCKATIRLELNLKNMATARAVPKVLVIPPSTNSELAVLIPAQGGRWSYKYNYEWDIGDYRARHNARAVYRLPYAINSRFRVNQGYNGTFSHFGAAKYATDFTMPIGTPVHCARKGLVVETVSHFKEGRPDRSLMKKCNRVTVLHPDGTLGDYVHLKPGGVAVRVGQKVKAGDLLGYSGNTGFTSGPHLHFEVSVPQADADDSKTIAVKFMTSKGKITLVEGMSYRHP